MSIDRSEFLESFVKRTPALNLIFLTYTGTPTKLLTDTPTIELFSDKQTESNFMDYCRSHTLVKQIIIFPQFTKKDVIVEFMDGSELRFALVRNMVRKSLKCLDATAIRENAVVNEFGMMVASNEHLFEYNMLKCQFDKSIPSDRFRNYIAALSFNSRSDIFKHIQTRFNLVFNTLEELYTHKANTLLNIMIGLRGEKNNTLIRMFFRGVALAFFKLFSFRTKKAIHIPASKGPIHAPEMPRAKRKTVGPAAL